jgi:hypothetical protein
LAYPDGLYEDSLTGGAVQAQRTFAIIAENGAGRMSGNDTYYRLEIDTTRSDLTGTFTAYSQNAAAGIQTTSGSITGVVTPSNLDATLTAQNSNQQSLALTFDSVYDAGSSLMDLAGNWTSSANGLSLTATIQPDGSFVGIDSNNCTYNGSFSLLDPNFNAYGETHVRSCGGARETFTGLAAVFPGTGTGVTATPTQIKLLTDNDAGAYLVAVFQ